MKIATIVGARPQFIKAAAFSRAVKELTDWEEIIIHTGQHYDANMSGVFFEEMEIPNPNYNLAINLLEREAMLAEMQERLIAVLQTESPDLVLVYGDTNSTLAGARAAKFLNIKLAHVEAGLRSFNLDMPEEHNRVETDKLSDLLFVPALQAKSQLIDEGVHPEKVFQVGDIMYDTVKYYSRFANARGKLENTTLDGDYCLLTLHRQENTDNPEVLKALLTAIDEIAKKQKVIWPIHPRTKGKMEALSLSTKAELIDPQGYFDMLRLIMNSKLVLTDSGGLQKEAFYLSKYCVTLRSETEWVELVDLGVNKVCGADQTKIIHAFKKFQSEAFAEVDNPYGKGNTAETIVELLKKN